MKTKKRQLRCGVISANADHLPGLQPPMRYRAQWVEDLPATPATGVVYVIGGRKYPYWAALACPSGQCSEVLHLGISDQHQEAE